MPIRDVLVTLIVVGSLPVCFARPWIGVLMWSWIGYMNPHKLTWGFAYGMPFAYMVAIATLAGIPFAKDRKPIPWTRETYALAALWLVYTLSTFAAMYPDAAWPQWEKVSKILLFTFITLMFFQDRERLRWLFLVIALSIGFYGLKGGVWSILKGGVHAVYGPAGSFLGSNNSVGLALNMTLPFLFYLQKDETRRWLRLLLRVTFWFSIVAILFTYSRGAFLALPVVLGLIFLKGRKNVLLGLLSIVVVLMLFMTFGEYMPGKWWERMATIQTYEEDNSARNRLEAWTVATNVALENPLLGGGFWVLANKATYAKYGYDAGRSAHSIYFAVLGDHGFIALGLFLFLLYGSLWSLYRLRWTAGRQPWGAWVNGPALTLEAAFVAYAIAGAFLTEAYFDLFYHMVSSVVILKVLARREAGAVARETVPTRRPLRRPAQAPGT